MLKGLSMKVSKLNHTKSAIVKKQAGIQGVLYQDPKKTDDQFIDIKKHLEDANKNAKYLFNVFNSIQKVNDYNKKHKEFINSKNGNRLINSTFIYKDKQFKSFDDVINIIKSSNKLNNDNLSICEECIKLYLRKDLKNQCDNFLLLYKSLGNKNINNDDEKLKQLYEAIRETYLKEKRFENIKKSIESNNMLVQPQGEFIKLSKQNDSVTRNQKEKEALIKFIDLYADINEDNRLKYLKRIMRLIEVFFLKSDSKELNENSYSTSILFNDFDILETLNNWKKEDSTFVSDEIINKYEKIKKESNPPKISNKDTNLQNVELKKDIRKQISSSYHNAIECLKNSKICIFEDKDINEFWIHHIENAVEKILSKVNVNSLYKLKNSYLKEKVRKDITNFISTKYIGIGKAVYQFGMNDITSEKEEIKLGYLNESTKKGITSFDYEKIKAEETLQREVAVAVAFATNNLSNATVDIKAASDKNKNATDFLLWDTNKTKKYLLDNTIKNVLQFFGGYSARDDMKETIHSYYTNNPKYNDNDSNEAKLSDANLVIDLKKFIYSLRNETMHFSTLDSGENELAHDFAKEMFANDINFCTIREKEKFCNVGLNLFYSDDKIKNLIIKLYEKECERASQVPSFNTVFSRNNFSAFLKDEFKLKPDFIDTHDEKNSEKWLNALYYTFKEIYYNLFLQDNRIKNYFEKALFDNNNSVNSFATKQFTTRYNKIKNRSFAEICQMFMSEYNMQNNSRKKKSTNEKNNNPDGYRFYVEILLKMIRLSFKEFVLKENYTRFLVDDAKDKFFVNNIKHENIEPKDFLPEVKLNLYDNLIKSFNEKPYLHKWYIMSRFLDGKTLNELVGSLRSYVQYVNDIIRRSESCRNKIKYQDSTLKKNQQIIRVVDMCTKLCSIYSNDINDYFNDFKEYEEFLSNYINDDCINDEIYRDEKNAIANRNIIEAKLFGPTNVLKKVLAENKINVNDISDFKNKRNEIIELKDKKDLNKEKQEKIVAYQNIKNLVELRNLVDYGKLINDLFGQLINWSYLRERDLLYFQLGFHYTCLNNDTEKPMDGYKEAMVDGCHIYNPILWQIASMYIYGIKMIVKEKESWSFDESRSSIGKKIGLFDDYSRSFGYEKDYLYNAGLEVFEVKKEHEEIINLRNSIDHFHYYYSSELSILDYYSIIFDRFFTYDVKYKKNVINLLCNILLRYKVLVKKISFASKTKEGNEKEQAQICITDDLCSEMHSYKLNNGKCKIYAKSNRYINDIKNILNYPNIELNETK